jgi:hypothetical protein
MYEFGVRYGATEFFDRVLNEQADDTAMHNPFAARCEVIELLCGTMDTSTQALIDTEAEEQASMGMRTPMPVLVLNISRSAPEGMLNTEVRADRDVTRHCSRYRLRAIVEYTSEKGGHFVTHVRHPCPGSPDKWHVCDDDQVTQCGTDPPKTASRWCIMLWYEQLPESQGGRIDYTPFEQSRRKRNELGPCTLRATGKPQSLRDQAHNIAPQAARIAAVDGKTVAESNQRLGYTFKDLRCDILCGYLSVHEPQLSTLAAMLPQAPTVDPSHAPTQQQRKQKKPRKKAHAPSRH